MPIFNLDLTEGLITDQWKQSAADQDLVLLFFIMSSVRKMQGSQFISAI